MNDLIDNIYEMIRIHEKNNWFSKAPEIVMICTPEYYCKTIMADAEQRVCYLGEDRKNKFIKLEIIGLKVPLILDNELKDNIQYTLMFRENYEKLEKEKMYKRFLDMWDK